MMLETLHKRSNIWVAGLGFFFLCILGCDDPVPPAPVKKHQAIVSKKITKPESPPKIIANEKENDAEVVSRSKASGGSEKNDMKPSGAMQKNLSGEQPEKQSLPESSATPAPVDEKLAKREKKLAESVVASSVNTEPLNASVGEVDPYDFKGRIDPFVPLLSEPDEASETKEREERPARILTPLEKMELSQIKLVAVIEMQRGSLAMVEEVSGKGYEVRVGTYMGRNGGRVIAINTDRIIVKEYIKDFKGKSRERTQEIKFNNDEGGE